MKVRLLALPFFLLCLFSCSKKLSDAVIIAKSRDVLNSKQTVTYDAHQKHIFSGIDEFNHSAKTHTFLDWSKADSAVANLKYHRTINVEEGGVSRSYEHLYDGYKELYIDNDEKKIRVDMQPVAFNGMSAIGIAD